MIMVMLLGVAANESRSANRRVPAARNRRQQSASETAWKLRLLATAGGYYPSILHARHPERDVRRAMVCVAVLPQLVAPACPGDDFSASGRRR
jgi:hypothetical protein